jgi:hypothetical protein
MALLRPILMIATLASLQIVASTNANATSLPSIVFLLIDDYG